MARNSKKNSSKCTCYSGNLRGINHKKYCFGTNEMNIWERNNVQFHNVWFLLHGHRPCVACASLLWHLISISIWYYLHFLFLSPLLTSFLSYDRKEWPCQERIYLIRILNLKVLICCYRRLLQSRFTKFAA